VSSAKSVVLKTSSTRKTQIENNEGPITEP